MTFPELSGIKSTLRDYLREMPEIGLRSLANIIPGGNIVQCAYDDKRGHVRMGTDTPAHVSIMGEIFYAMLAIALVVGGPTHELIKVLPLAIAVKIPVGLEGIYNSYAAMQKAAGPVSGSPPLAQQTGIETVVTGGRAPNSETKTVAI